jgi:hypothetical protein
MNNLWNGPETVGELLDLLAAFPREWPIKVSTPAGGGIAVEHREIAGRPVVAIFGKNGGSFGENPLTETEYKEKSDCFLRDLWKGRLYTSIHGDHRTYSPNMGEQATCYGTHYDRRVIERMVADGLIPEGSVDLEKVARFEKLTLT